MNRVCHRGTIGDRTDTGGGKWRLTKRLVLEYGIPENQSWDSYKL